MIESFHNVAAALPWFFPLVAFVVGACVGSFLNVCIYRLPAGESLVRPPSHCACGKPIRWYDNIPILSWFILRGRARCCGRRYGFRYPLVESLTACVFLAVFLLYPPALWLPMWAFAALMIASAFIDLDTMELPDCLTVGGAVLGVIFAFAIPSLHDAQDASLPFLAQSFRSGASALVGAGAGAGAVVWVRELGRLVFRKEAMGEGDIVLAGCIGAFCGWQGALFALFGGSVLGALLLVPWTIFRALRGKKMPSTVPFGPWLALGALAYALGAQCAVDAYFENLKSLLFP